MPFSLDQGHGAHEPVQTLVALVAFAHQGEEPLASSEQQSSVVLDVQIF